MVYNNLVEDEKEARNERYGMKFAFALILIGIFFIWFKYGKKE
jgi:hypothetical protein